MHKLTIQKANTKNKVVETVFESPEPKGGLVMIEDPNPREIVGEEFYSLAEEMEKLRRKRPALKLVKTSTKKTKKKRKRITRQKRKQW